MSTQGIPRSSNSFLIFSWIDCNGYELSNGKDSIGKIAATMGTEFLAESSRISVNEAEKVLQLAGLLNMVRW
jgi:hypothetical protein